MIVGESRVMFPRNRNNLLFMFALISCAGVSQETQAEFIKVDPRGTYLNSRFVSGIDANPIDLTVLGLYEGDTIQLRQLGDYSTHSDGQDDTITTLVGVFSTTSTLLSRNDGRPGPFEGSHVNQLDYVPSLNDWSGSEGQSGPRSDVGDTSTAFTPAFIKRVPGAIDVGTDYRTSHGNIEEDFLITDLTLVLPEGARYLFLDSNDEHYTDNTDPDFDFGVEISLVPEPAALGILSILLAIPRRRRQSLR